MRANARAALLVACAAVATALTLVPHPSSSPLGRVASIDGDGPDPTYDAPLDAAAMRRAGAIVPDDGTYAIVAPDASPLLQGNLKAAAQLFLAPALPLQDVREAEWVLIYGESAADFPGHRALGGDLALFRARP